MLRRTLLIFSLMCTALLIGCMKSETTNNSNSTATNSNKTASNGSTSSTSTASAEKIGVPECDEFLTAYDACVSKRVPEAQRGQYETTLQQWRDSWRLLASNPATKGMLAAQCKQIAEQARTSMKSYNCKF